MKSLKNHFFAVKLKKPIVILHQYSLNRAEGNGAHLVKVCHWDQSFNYYFMTSNPEPLHLLRSQLYYVRSIYWTIMKHTILPNEIGDRDVFPPLLMGKVPSLSITNVDNRSTSRPSSRNTAMKTSSFQFSHFHTLFNKLPNCGAILDVFEDYRVIYVNDKFHTSLIPRERVLNMRFVEDLHKSEDFEQLKHSLSQVTGGVNENVIKSKTISLEGVERSKIKIMLCIICYIMICYFII